MNIDTLLIALLLAGLLVALPGTTYLWTLALAGARRSRRAPAGEGRTRFAVLIPAHDEGGTIGATVATLRRMDYPEGRFEVYVVADHCADDTAARARAAGAVALERREGPRGSKGAALAWLVDQVLARQSEIDALVVFDADTQVDRAFLKAMDGHFSQGARVVQGRHCISNPQDGLYPALADAMMRIDNRCGNQGRANLGLSAKHMGDSIAFKADVARHVWQEQGLTEDYALRQRLLLSGIRIDYAPEAVGWGEAPASWQVARRQRERWLSGTFAASAGLRRRMLTAALRRRSAPLLDGALQAYLPAFSTLGLLAAGGAAAATLLLALQATPPGPQAWLLPLAWLAVLASLVAYPFFGLGADGAPPRAHLALLAGPFFIVWRTGLAIGARFLGRDIAWRRTERRAS